jgi:formylglycine-generating enzyme required for sulfatase activity
MMNRNRARLLIFYLKDFYLVLLMLLAVNGWCNNIQVTNLSLVDENRQEGSVMIKFDISWENSWRLSSGAMNWDAAWIFFKYRVGNGEWQHVNLDNLENAVGVGTPASLTIAKRDRSSPYHISTNPIVGIFIYRSNPSSGVFTNAGVKLKWNYESNGINTGANVDIKAFAVEMVNIPEGNFNVGGGGGTDAFTSTTINTALATTPPVGTGSLGGQAGGYPTNQTPPLSNDWPNGYSEFYCFKYEISQQQYIDFLNCLTQSQANNRLPSANTNRFGIAGSSVGTYTAQNPDIACNFLGWNDGAAYADWACLRPMTELEFEKVCRGNLMPVNGEYAWGSTSITSNAYGLENSGASNESISLNYSSTSGNAGYSNTLLGGIDGPVRVGIFSANPLSISRVTAGSSYLGVMELSGNTWERCISIAGQGKIFTGNCGDGQLDTDGNANVSFWPGTSAAGVGQRGGSWNTPAAFLQISDRTEANNTNTARQSDFGFRAVR